MTYNEMDHPRDELGRWTNKDGSGNSGAKGGENENVNENERNYSEYPLKAWTEKTDFNPLHEKLKIQSEKEEIEKEYRNVLLDTLGPLATPPIMFYGETKQLETMIKDNNLTDKLNEALEKNPVAQRYINSINEKITLREDSMPEENLSGSDLSYNKENMQNQNYTKDEVKPISVDDAIVQKYIEEDKILRAQEEKNRLLFEAQQKEMQQKQMQQQQQANAQKNTTQTNTTQTNKTPVGLSTQTSNKAPASAKYTRPVSGVITSGYGKRMHPIYKRIIFHDGIDMNAPIGTPVKAIAGGKVEKAETMNGYGKVVQINHGVINGKKVTSKYAHLSKYEVKVGDVVKAGQVVAKSGNTGGSTGPHLHVTIFENGASVNPTKYIK